MMEATRDQDFTGNAALIGNKRVTNDNDIIETLDADDNTNYAI